MDSDAIPVWIIIAIVACAIAMYIIYYFPRSSFRKTIVSHEKININKKRTILDCLEDVSTLDPKRTAFKIKSGKDWIDISYKKYYNNVVNFSDSVNYWLGTNINIGLIGLTCPGWIYSYLGCMMNGGTTVVIDPNNSSDKCNKMVNDFNVQMIVCDGDQLEKFIDIVDDSNVKLIIYYSPIKSDLVEKFNIPVISMGIFVTETNGDRDDLFEEHNICVIDSNGHKHTHEQLTSKLKKITDTLGNTSPIHNEQLISYLPLNNIVLQTFDIYLPIITHSTIWFPNRSAVEKSMLNVIGEIKPTMFIGNTIWELIQKEYENESLVTKILTKQFIEKIGMQKSKINVYYESNPDSGIKIASSLMNDFKIIDSSWL